MFLQCSKCLQAKANSAAAVVQLEKTRLCRHQITPGHVTRIRKVLLESANFLFDTDINTIQINPKVSGITKELC